MFRAASDIVGPTSFPGLECLPRSFDGVLVGFGGASGRNFRTSEGWEAAAYLCDITGKPVTPTDFVYKNSWGVTSEYLGQEPGDSGGALMTTYADVGKEVFLCGVTSRRYPVINPASEGNDEAALDSAANEQFMLDAGLVGPKGNFFGECPGVSNGGCPNAYLDSDDDGIPDCCDNCISIVSNTMVRRRRT